MTNNFKILYIIGAGRSGTTLLNIVLSNSGNVFNAGELNRYTKRDGLPHEPRDNNVKKFWKKVNDQLIQKNYKNSRYYYSVFQKFEYHYGFLRVLFSMHSKWFSLYARYQQQLFLAICSSVKQKKELLIIDSSKYPIRGYYLSKIFGNKVLLLYIKRQPSAVVESFQKRYIEQPSKRRIASHLYLLIVNFIAGAIINRLKKTNKVCVISYDKFINSPTEILQKIEKDLVINLCLSKEIISKNNTFKVGNMFDGNRLRLYNKIRFNKQLSKPKEVGHILNKLFFPLHKLIWYKNLES